MSLSVVYDKKYDKKIKEFNGKYQWCGEKGTRMCDDHVSLFEKNFISIKPTLREHFILPINYRY